MTRSRELLFKADDLWGSLNVYSHSKFSFSQYEIIIVFYVESRGISIPLVQWQWWIDLIWTFFVWKYSGEHCFKFSTCIKIHTNQMLLSTSSILYGVGVLIYLMATLCVVTIASM